MSTETAYFGYEKRLEDRLRSLNIYLDGKWEHPAVCSEAANEIKRLTVLNAELVVALERIATGHYYNDAKDLARAALAKVKGKEATHIVGPGLEDAEMWLRKRNENTAAAEVGEQEKALMASGLDALASIGIDGHAAAVQISKETMAKLIGCEKKLAATIERCAQVAEQHTCEQCGTQIAAVIRKMKDE